MLQWVTVFFAKKFLTKSDQCDGLLSWRRHQLLVLSFGRHFFLTISLRWRRMSMYISLFTVLPSGMNSQWTLPWQSKKNFQCYLSFIPVDLNFLLQSDDDDLYSEFSVLFVDHTKKHHVSSPVTLLLRYLSLSAILMKSPEMLIHVSFCSGFSFQGTKCW